jgi:hypothetical protein
MASWTGVVYNPPSMAPTQMAVGAGQMELITPTLVPQYKMTGYYVTGATYETWTAYGFPNTTPPSGHTLTGISYVQIQG